MRIPSLPKILIAITTIAAAAFIAPVEATVVPAKVLQKLTTAKAEARTSLVLGGLALEGGEEITLDLERFEVFTPSFQLVIDGVPQPVGVGRPDTVYFRGSVRGAPGSLAVVAVGRTIRGFIQTSRGVHLLVPSNDAYRSSDASRTFLLPVTSVPGASKPFRCAAEAAGPSAEGQGPRELSGPAAPTWVGTRNVEVAIETDYELYAKFGNATALLEYIGDLAAAASAIYLRDIQTTIQVFYVSLWSDANDQWIATNSNWAVGELGDYWFLNRSGVPRGTVHQLSGRITGGGAAWINALCKADYFTIVDGGIHIGGSYGFSGDLKGQFSVSDSSFYWDLWEFVHELGHNFGSMHTHCYGAPSFPVDHCFALEAGCYAGPTSLPPGGGTIMSYCHTLPGYTANINLVIGSPGQPSDVVRQTMRQYIESVTCSCEPPYTPVLAYPANGATGVTAGTLYWENPYSLPGWLRPSGVTSYEVYLDTVSPPEKRISTSSVNPWMAMPTWFPNTTYYWKVVAKNGCGSAPSAVFSFTTGSACSFAGTIPSLGVSKYGRKVELVWDSIPGAAHYTVYLGTTNPPMKAYKAVYAPQNWLEVTVAPGTTYYWRVKVTPGCGNNPAVYSIVDTFTTNGDPLSLTSMSPTLLDRWGGSTSLYGTGIGLTSDNLLFVDSAGRSAGTFTFGGAFGTSMSGTIAMDPTAPSDWYDVGLTNYGFEHQRLPLAVAVKAFTDVPEDQYYFQSSSRVVDAGIMEADVDPVTPGPQFSPTTVVTREYMAEYLAKAYQWWRTGSIAVPSATCVPSGGGSTDFPDVPCSHPRWLYIHWIKAWGVTVGSPCELGICYLPNNTVDRSQMVTFLLRLKYGTTLPSLLSNFGSRDPGCGEPWPTCVGWTDPGLQVPATTWPHAEANVAFSDRLTTGCAAGPPRTFCQTDPVPRGQMVEFLARIVNLVPNP